MCRNCLDVATGELKPNILDYIDSATHFLNSDQDRDVQLFQSMKLHFCKCISLLINQFGVDQRVSLFPEKIKYSMYILFTQWCSDKLGMGLDRKLVVQCFARTAH